MICNDFECIWLFTKSTWILLKECPRACVCNPPENTDSPNDNEIIKSVCISGDYQSTPSYCSGYCEFDWIFLENQNIGYWSLATNLCNHNCKCGNISYPGFYANQRVRVDCVSNCEPPFYKNYFQYSNDLHSCIELEERNYSNYLSYCLSGISTLGDPDILNYPTNNKDYYLGYIIDNAKVVKPLPGKPINYSKEFVRTFYGMTQDMNAVSIGSFLAVPSVFRLGVYPFLDQRYLATYQYNFYVMGLPILEYEYTTDRFICNDLFELGNTDFYCRIKNIHCPIDSDLLFLEANIDHDLNVKFDFDKFRSLNVRLGDHTVGMQHIENYLNYGLTRAESNVYINIDLPHFIGYIESGLGEASVTTVNYQPRVITRLSFMSQLRRLNLNTFGIFGEFLTYVEDSNLGPFIGNIGARMHHFYGIYDSSVIGGIKDLPYLSFDVLTGEKATHNFNKAQIAILPKYIKNAFFEIFGDHVYTKIIKTYETCNYKITSVGNNCNKFITSSVLNKNSCHLSIVVLYDNQPFKCARNDQSLISYFLIERNRLDLIRLSTLRLGKYEIWLGTKSSGKAFYNIDIVGGTLPLLFSRKKLISHDSSIQCTFHPDDNFNGRCKKDQYIYCGNSKLPFYGNINECLIPAQLREMFLTHCYDLNEPDCEYAYYYTLNFGIGAGFFMLIITDVISEEPFIANAVLIFYSSVNVFGYYFPNLIGCPAITSSYVTIREIPKPTCN